MRGNHEDYSWLEPKSRQWLIESLTDDSLFLRSILNKDQHTIDVTFVCRCLEHKIIEPVSAEGGFYYRLTEKGILILWNNLKESSEKHYKKFKTDREYFQQTSNAQRGSDERNQTSRGRYFELPNSVNVGEKSIAQDSEINRARHKRFDFESLHNRKPGFFSRAAFLFSILVLVSIAISFVLLLGLRLT